MQSRLTALVVDAALDANMLRQARAGHLRRHPQSPDSADSLAPPSYAEAAPPPPKYEDIVLDCQLASGSHTAGTTPEVVVAPVAANAPYTEDSAGPDNGQDTDLLVV